MAPKKKSGEHKKVTAVSVYGFAKRSPDSYQAGDDSHWLIRFRDVSLLGDQWTPWRRLPTSAWDRLTGCVAVEQSYDAYQLSEGLPTVESHGSLMYAIVHDRDDRAVLLSETLRLTPAGGYPDDVATDPGPDTAA